MSKKYQPYIESDIKTLLTEPWEVSDRPYMLHAAYALNCLYDIVVSDDEEDENESQQLWGSKIEKKILDRLVLDIKADFNDAASNRKPIQIWGKSYSIRKVNSYDPERLHLIFNFPFMDDEYCITKDGIMNLAGTVDPRLQIYEVTKEQAQRNRTYLRQIIMLAEDDKGNGWDKLTDMEVTVYCWALYYNKYQFDSLVQFKKLYKDYLYISEQEIESCYNEKSSLRQTPVGMYAFSYDKIQDWHKSHGLISEADKINPSDADDYWYDVALKTTFKPIDQQ